MLKAYTLYRPDEGYCQAQAPIAAVLLMHMPAEVKMHNNVFAVHIQVHILIRINQVMIEMINHVCFICVFRMHFGV